MLDWAMINQSYQGVVSPPPHAPILEARVRECSRINPPEFHGSKADHNDQEFIDELYDVLAIIGVNSEEKVEMITYQLKGGGPGVVHSIDVPKGG